MLKPIDTSDWSRRDILKEASLQSAALARLGVWKRLAYSVTAVGFIVGFWAMGAAVGWGVPVAVALIVAGGFASLVLTVGTSRGKRNVESMLTAAGVDVDDLMRPRGKKDVDDAHPTR